MLSLSYLGVPPFEPRKLYGGSLPGLYSDPSDLLSEYQDSAGTIAAAVNQPVGLANDKSGNAKNLQQVTAVNRPVLQQNGSIWQWNFNGTNSALATATFVAGALTNNMDCFIAIQRNAVVGLAAIANAAAGLNYFGRASAGGVGASFANCGAPTVWVDSAQIGTTEGNLDTALTVGPWHILELHNLDLSAWTALFSGYYSASYVNSLNLSPIILAAAQNDAIRTRLRRWIGAKVGMSL